MRGISGILLSTALSFLSLTLSPMAVANPNYTGADNFSSGCATLEFMAKMLTVNTLLPANWDSQADMQAMSENLKQMNQRVCQQVLLTETTRYDARYSNGRIISPDLYHEAWYFPNGQLFMAGAGRDVSVYYPNGQVMAYHWTHSDQTVFWPNGNPATFSFRVHHKTWFYPDGQIITYRAGNRGERWFYPFPRMDGRTGQELISDRWGVEDEDFNFLNFTARGDVYLTRERIRRKLVLTDFDLLDVPGVLLMVTRLYQVEDDARLFVPADSSITGAPY